MEKMPWSPLASVCVCLSVYAVGYKRAGTNTFVCVCVCVCVFVSSRGEWGAYINDCFMFLATRVSFIHVGRDGLISACQTTSIQPANRLETDT